MNCAFLIYKGHKSRANISQLMSSSETSRGVDWVTSAIFLAFLSGVLFVAGTLYKIEYFSQLGLNFGVLDEDPSSVIMVGAMALLVPALFFGVVATTVNLLEHKINIGFFRGRFLSETAALVAVTWFAYQFLILTIGNQNWTGIAPIIAALIWAACAISCVTALELRHFTILKVDRIFSALNVFIFFALFVTMFTAMLLIFLLANLQNAYWILALVVLSLMAVAGNFLLYKGFIYVNSGRDVDFSKEGNYVVGGEIRVILAALAVLFLVSSSAMAGAALAGSNLQGCTELATVSFVGLETEIEGISGEKWLVALERGVFYVRDLPINNSNSEIYSIHESRFQHAIFRTYVPEVTSWRLC
jgi:hypothetical protein